MPLVLLAIIGLLWLLIAAHRRQLGFRDLSLRGALVIAWVAFEALTALITESTSLGHHFTSTTVRVVWVGVLAILAGVAWPDVRRIARAFAVYRSDRLCAYARIRQLSIEDRLWLIVVVVAFGLLTVVGWLYPPNNTDSIIYHLPRVEHWIQAASVAHFATHYLHQIEFSPLHEFNLAHLHLLWGGDRLDGYVQLFAAVICVVGVSELARLLGASRRGQIIASVLCVMIPSGILQATSTSNNYFAASIGLAVLVTLVAWDPALGWRTRALTLGLAGGLAVLAKGNIPLMIAPAAVLLGVLMLRRDLRTAGRALALRRMVAIVAIAGIGALVIAGPFLWRNVELFGGPTGPNSADLVNEDFNVRADAGNVIRNIAVNFRIGDGSDGVDTIVSNLALGSLGRMYSLLGVSQTDPRYEEGDVDAFAAQDYSLATRLEDTAANPWHVILSVIAAFALVVWVIRGERKLRTALVLSVGLAAGFVLFTGMARWNVYVARLQLPLLVAWCAIIAVVLDRLARVIGVVVVAALVFACMPALIDNAARPLDRAGYQFASDLEPYFVEAQIARDLGSPKAIGAARREVAAYETMVDAIGASSCERVGLSNLLVHEYALWAGLRHAGWRGTIEAVDVGNESRQLEDRAFRPCARMRQVDAQYAPPDDGNVHLAIAPVALSIDPDRASTIRTSLPGFSSSVRGVRVLPGGGWSFLATDHPILNGAGSIFLFGKRPRDVQLQMHPVARTMPPDLLVRGPGGQLIPTNPHDGTIGVDLHLRPGINRLRVTSRPSPESTDVRVELATISVGPIPPS